MKRLVFLLVCAAAAMAQNNQVLIRPDCQIPFTFTSTGTTSTLDNRQGGCTFWTVTYSSTGFSAISLVLQSAPNSSGVPGAWTTFAGATISVGVNPNVATTQAFTQLVGYNPFVRMNLASATGSGTVVGFAYGCRTPGCGAGGTGGGGGATSNVNVAQVAGTPTVTGGVAGLLAVGGTAANGAAISGDPVLTAYWDGANVRVPVFCPNSADINVSSLGENQIVALSGTRKIYVCQLQITAASAVSFTIDYGTGVSCGSGTGVLAHYQSVSTALLPFGSTSPLTTPASQALCLNLGSAVTVQGVVFYAQF